MSLRTLGSAQTQTDSSSLQIASCGPTGFSLIAHDPTTLNQMMQNYDHIPMPKMFAPGLALRNQINKQLARVYDNPFCCSVTTTVPVAMDWVEATVRSGGNGATGYEFNMMRTVDFIGRNYLLIELPRIDCSEIRDSCCSDLTDPKHCFLGAWHRDLVPRIIRSLSFYSRANNHTLFEYSGYDIYLFNMLFGNAQKELNDIMAGEDKFELGYDPYYVNGAALGLASFKGINPFKGIIDNGDGSVTVNDVVNCLQIDTCMDKEEFREFYRRGVWFETPSMKGGVSRHSIHSRRMVHNPKTLWIPLDILPFGYSLSSAIPVGAIHGDAGYIHLDIYNNWLDRAFYITRLSDIPTLYTLPNHTHYVAGDKAPDGSIIGKEVGNDPRIAWVNETSLGRYADPTFINARPEDAVISEDARVANNVFNTIVEGQLSKRETNANLAGATAVPSESGFAGFGTKEGLYTVGQYGKYEAKLGKVIKEYRKANLQEELDTYIYPISKICPTYYEQIKNTIGLRLIQVGYKTLPSVRDLMIKLPSIYITTEWHDTEFVPNSRTHIEVLNDLYIEAIAMWFIPEDNNGIESMRMYPNHYIDHELDVINGIRISNENGQGVAYYTWAMLNMVGPSVLNLQNPLIENMGVIPFSPTLVSNKLPYSFYDTNVNGQLRIDILPFEGDNAIGNSNVAVNMKRGKLLIMPIGLNGLGIANLQCYRIIW